MSVNAQWAVPATWYSVVWAHNWSFCSRTKSWCVSTIWGNISNRLPRWHKLLAVCCLNWPVLVFFVAPLWLPKSGWVKLCDPLLSMKNFCFTRSHQQQLRRVEGHFPERQKWRQPDSGTAVSRRRGINESVRAGSRPLFLLAEGKLTAADAQTDPIAQV